MPSFLHPASLFSVRTGLLFGAWVFALLGTLQVHRWEGLLGGHAICGPWGCGPFLSALIGYHGFWLILLLLPAWLLAAGFLAAGFLATGFLATGFLATGVDASLCRRALFVSLGDVC